MFNLEIWYMNLQQTTFADQKQSHLNQNSFLQSKHIAWKSGLPPSAQFFVTDDVPAIISVGGGKGGVGKSFISANLAASLGKMGFKILLIDLDMGGANLHTYLGMGVNHNNLADFVLYEHCRFEDVVQQSTAENVFIVSGGKDEVWALEVEGNTTGSFGRLWEAILQSKTRHGFDFVILDLGAGIHHQAVEFFQASHLGILSVLPEPTSIENAYTFLKATNSRLMENIGSNLEEYDAAYQAKELLTSRGKIKGVSYAERIRSMYQDYPKFVEEYFYALTGRQIGIVINQVHSQRDVDIGTSMNQICANFFAFESKFLGFLNYDESARKSLRNKRLLVKDFPHAILTKRVSDVAVNVKKSLGF